MPRRIPVASRIAAAALVCVGPLVGPASMTLPTPRLSAVVFDVGRAFRNQFWVRGRVRSLRGFKKCAERLNRTGILRVGGRGAVKKSVSHESTGAHNPSFDSHRAVQTSGSWSREWHRQRAFAHAVGAKRGPQSATVAARGACGPALVARISGLPKTGGADRRRPTKPDEPPPSGALVICSFPRFDSRRAIESDSPDSAPWRLSLGEQRRVSVD